MIDLNCLYPVSFFLMRQLFHDSRAVFSLSGSAAGFYGSRRADIKEAVYASFSFYGIHSG